MNKHTQGPWQVFICDDGGEWSGWPLSIYSTTDDKKCVVRTGGQWPYTWDENISQAEAISNAKLIAAAPELLNACLMMVSDSFSLSEAMEAIHSAITKAKGE